MRHLLLSFCFVAVSSVLAAELFVNHETGKDSNAGSSDAPFATAQHAVGKAQAGDTIHLLPENAIYRQKILLSNKSGLTIMGHGVTLDGADPLPDDGWEKVADDLHRRQMPAKAIWNGRLLIINGHAQRMGNSPTVKKDYPKPAELKAGEFSWEVIDEKTGWLYVRGPLEKLEWAARETGLGTGGTCRDVTIRDLKVCHILNDGFNIHGDCRGFKFFNIQGWDNFDEGFSAHDTCECFIEDGEFWGNDNAVADVNAADTYYKRCTFRDSVSTEVLFQGGTHSLDDCKIIASGVAFSLASGGVPKTNERSPGACRIANCSFTSRDEKPKRFALDTGTTFSADKCTLDKISFSSRSAAVELKESTLNGEQWMVKPKP